jgi:hypothetical protein
MLDTDAITRMIEKQITEVVNQQVLTVLTDDQWLVPLEQKILQYTQDRILSKFANASTMPEIIDAVKESVRKLFVDGNIPGIDQFIDPRVIKNTVDQAVEQITQLAIEQFSQDLDWQARVQTQINQIIVQETLSRLGSIDLGPTIKGYVDEGMKQFTSTLVENFHSTGIQDQAAQCELTVMDDMVVVENCLTATHIEAVDSARIQNLVVTGSINTDNQSWSALAAAISQQTLNQLTVEWAENLTQQVVKQIQEKGIRFEDIQVGDEKLVNAGKLSSAITESNLQSVGILKTLQVRGETHINNNTVNVLNKRLGINTDTPEKALSVWDEEVSVVIGKHKVNQAYIGTNRDQGIVIGVNREPQIELNTNGLTTVKKLQIGLHKISHDTQVPGWAGTRGDLVLNSNPSTDRVFAWVCLGAHRWQVLKSAE